MQEKFEDIYIVTIMKWQICEMALFAFFSWIVLRILIWHLLWRFEPKWNLLSNVDKWYLMPKNRSFNWKNNHSSDQNEFLVHILPSIDFTGCANASSFTSWLCSLSQDEAVLGNLEICCSDEWFSVRFKWLGYYLLKLRRSISLHLKS